MLGAGTKSWPHHWAVEGGDAGSIDTIASLHQDAVMRTTLSIDQDLYDIALAIARDRRQSLSSIINELLRNGLTATSDEPLRISKKGFPSFRTSRRVTLDDVRSLEDET